MPAAKHTQLTSGKSALMKRKNELWYLRRLKVVAEDAKAEVVPDLAKLIATLPKTSDQVTPGDRATISRAIAEIVKKARINYTAPLNPKRTARFAASMNLQSTDVWFMQVMKSYLPIVPAQLPQPRITMDAATARHHRPRLGLQGGAVRPLSTLSIIHGQPEIQSAFDDAVETNIGLITSIPPQYFDRMEDVLLDQVSTAERWETLVPRLKDGIAQVNNLSDYRVKLIARDQTAKMSAAFNEARTRSVGIDEYTWTTAGDERVRESHADNDGQVFSFDEGAPIDDDGTMGNPGDAVNCRCVAIPYIEELEEDEEAA